MEDYIYIKNYLNNDNIKHIIEKLNDKVATDSKVGNRIGKEKKIRKDKYFSKVESEQLDEILFSKASNIVLDNYDVNLKYRETYKAGIYYGDEKGFYIPHTDIQGNMGHRKFSMVICLSNVDDYTGGEFMFTLLKKKYRFDRGDAIIFKSELLHGVSPVENGKRQVLITFMWDDDGEKIRNNPKNNPKNSNHYKPLVLTQNIPTLSIISVNSGPGNQLVGIKEGLLMSKYANRTFVFPPIIQHYVLNRKYRGSSDSVKIWDFDEIFTYNNSPNKNQLHEYKDSTEITCYYIRKIDTEIPLNNELLLKKNIIKKLITTKTFSDIDSYKFIKNIQENDILVAHLYNNTKISNCFWNGCEKCEINNSFFEDYKDICKKLDFSPKIKDFSYDIINKLFGTDKSYICIHMRYPDYGNVDIKDINNLYDEKNIDNYIINFCKKNNISTNNIFICTSNKKIISDSVLGKYHILNKSDKYNELESFIEQYICCLSTHFFYTGGIHAKPTDKHIRSTWTSFVIDYRNFLLNNNNNYNFTNIFSTIQDINSENKNDTDSSILKTHKNLL